MLTRSEHARAEAVNNLHDAWNSATQRERAAWISELRHNALNTLKDACETLLADKPPAVRRKA